ncbi:MAG: hypothetical protein QOF01_2643 [Thermomicrobiales bacterium]|nr:hypothetical protein [Thermomicrobiales bacterium]
MRRVPRVPAKSEEVVAVREAIEARNAEVVTFKHIPGWLTTAMERAVEKCEPGQTPTVLVAEKPRGRNPTRIFLVTDVLREVEAGAQWTTDIAEALKAEPSQPD